MPSAVSNNPLARLAPLRQVSTISRKVSLFEYYHASVGASPHTLEGPRNLICVVSGELDDRLQPEDWQRAIDQIVVVNPGLRLRWHGRWGFSRWVSDGPPPRLRIIDGCTWDALTSDGSDFITEEPLSLRVGPTVEFIIAKKGNGRAFVILRTLHAIMDGMGVIHALHELFRALRGEPLLGSNASFSDTDLMQAIDAPPNKSKHLATCWLTGDPEGDLKGDDWWRVKLGPARKQLLAHVAVAMAEYAHQNSDLPVLIAIPIDIRRHVSNLRSTTNFSSMVFVRLEKGDGAEVFQQRLLELLEMRREVAFSSILNLIRWLPLPWVDRLLGRSEKNYRTRKPLETFVISNLGKADLAAMSVASFKADDLMVFPMEGSAFGVLMSVDGEVQITLNLPRVLSSNHRAEQCIQFLQSRLAAG